VLSSRRMFTVFRNSERSIAMRVEWSTASFFTFDFEVALEKRAPRRRRARSGRWNTWEQRFPGKHSRQIAVAK
jgi:hypothetical protein